MDMMMMVEVGLKEVNENLEKVDLIEGATLEEMMVFLPSELALAVLGQVIETSPHLVQWAERFQTFHPLPQPVIEVIGALLVVGALLLVVVGAEGTAVDVAKATVARHRILDSVLRRNLEDGFQKNQILSKDKLHEMNQQRLILKSTTRFPWRQVGESVLPQLRIGVILT